MLIYEPDGGLCPAPPLQVVAVLREVRQQIAAVSTIAESSTP